MESTDPMSVFERYFTDPEFVSRYVDQGPPAFMPGHGGVLQMAGVLIRERAPADGVLLVVGAGGGLDTRALAKMEPGWRFVGVDPSPRMLDLARAVVGEEAAGRVHLVEGTVADAPEGPFDAATLILVLGMIPDDGSKLTLLEDIRRRLRPGAPFVLVDRCDDRDGPQFRRNIERYAAYAIASGVDPATVAGAHESQAANTGLVPGERDEALLAEAGFGDVEAFYRGMEWRGWVAYA